jgi:acetolactate synthase-1/2/3 large subunit
MGLGAFPCDHPQSLYWYGMHGTVAGNWAVCKSDLAHRHGRPLRRPHHRRRREVRPRGDDRPHRHRPLRAPEEQVRAPSDPARTSSTRSPASPRSPKKGFKKPDLKKWFETINGWKKEHPYPFSYERKTKHILPQEAIQVLCRRSKGKAIVSTGVGQHQMWAGAVLPLQRTAPLRQLRSALGTMGFGLPAAIGAKVASPDTQVIDIDGDGSFLMNIQELATAMTIEKIAAKVLILNNQHLGMVVQWEDRFYAGTRGHTILGDAKNIGSPDNPGGLYPDFVKIANGFGIRPARW